MRSLVLALAVLTATAATPLAQSGKTASAAAEGANKHYSQGWSAIRAESWRDAVREFEATIEADPQFALAYYSLGRAYMGLKEFDSAIAAYTKCRDLFTHASSQFGDQMTSRQRLNDRIFEYQTALNQALSRNSGTGRGNNQSQSLYVRELQAEIMRLEQARDRGLLDVSIDARVPYYVPMALGAAYFRRGLFADAEREYKAAIESNGASGETHSNLAVLYLVTGRYEEADNEVKAAEKVGFRVNEELKGDIRKHRAGR